MPANRKHHVKSRHGCQQCKARRTKCDEVRPICTKCARRGGACSFSEDPSSLIFVEGHNSRKQPQKKAEPVDSGLPSSASPTATSTASPGNESARHGSTTTPSIDVVSEHSQPQDAWDSAEPEAPAPATHLEADNLRLMRHFTLHAWRTCVSDPDGVTEEEASLVWRDIVPELACTHGFLLHAILAVSALHQALAGPCEPEYSTGAFRMPPRPSAEAMANLARYHHTLAVPLLRTVIAGPISEDLQAPLFVTAIAIAMYAVGAALLASLDPRQGLHPENEVDDPIEALVQVINLLHGISSIVRPAENYLASTPLSTYMLPFPKEPLAPLHPSADAFLASVQALVSADPERCNPADLQDYAVAIGTLRITFILHAERPGRQMLIVPVPIKAPDLVLADIAARRPAALCIAAGYATILHTLRGHVWFQGWGACVVRAIALALQATSPDAAAVVRWCVEQVDAYPEVDRIRRPGYDNEIQAPHIHSELLDVNSESQIDPAHKQPWC